MTSKLDKEIKEIRQNLDFLKASIENRQKENTSRIEVVELTLNKKLCKILDKLNLIENNIEKINKNLKPFLETQGFTYE